MKISEYLQCLEYALYSKYNVNIKIIMRGKFDVTWVSRNDSERVKKEREKNVKWELYHDPKEKLYVFRVYKLRDYNVPSKIREGQSAEPIDLEDDESLGEDMTVLYDWKNSICMIQQNRMSVGVSRLAEWINKENGYDVSKKVVFYPISDHFTKNKLRNKYIRTIEFSFSNMESVNEDGPLSSIINSIGRYDGVSAKITISVGRARDAQLNPQNSYDLIEDIQKNSGCIGSARAKLKSMSDDDKARIEMVDIFETTSHDYIDFDIIEKKPLDFLQARRKMCRGERTC